jgi:hypothetical protein
VFGSIGEYSIGQNSSDDGQAGALINMLTAADLSYMRDSTELLMPDTCNIITITNTPDGAGGQTQTRGTSSAVAFRLDVISKMGTGESVSAGAVQAFMSYKGSLPYDTTVTTDNQILHNGVFYAVTLVNTNQSWIAVKRVDLEKI